MSDKQTPWEAHPEIWATSTAFFTYLRGCLRKAWVKNPIKLNYIKKNRKQIPNPNPKGNKPTVWGFTCECCNQEHVIKDGQVDHKFPAGSLRTPEDIQGFVERLLFVTDEDIQLVCKPCHEVITYQQKHNITFAQAKITKKAIAFSKLPAQEQKDYLDSHNVSYGKGTKALLKESYIKFHTNLEKQMGHEL